MLRKGESVRENRRHAGLRGKRGKEMGMDGAT
jgi:hypothetical protein